jgi:prepilin-type N-terminal cleavage/methylation domain-containing protein
MKNKHRKGFTLIELLVVIAIIAVLSVVVILSLNPAELLRQARDSNRISDMATLKSALGLYLADVTSPSMGTYTNCYMGLATGTIYAPASSTGSFAATTTCTQWFNTASAAITSTASRVVSGAGWIPVNFTSISSGAPLGQEPVDPVNQAGTGTCTGTSPSLSSCALVYTYTVSSTVFKIASFMESTKYSTGTAGVQNTDGGLNPFVYEQGTNLSL